MFSESTVEGKSFSDLLAFLSATPVGDGSIYPSQIWRKLAEVQDSDLDSLGDGYDRLTVESMKSTHRRPRNMLRVLRALTRSLEECNVDLEHRMDRAGIKHGIGILPYNIISNILVSTRPTLMEAVKMAHISSQFRQAMLSSPRIWASYGLHTRMSSEQIVFLANRSGTLSLSACISSRHTITDWYQCVYRILSLRTRLKKLVIEDICELSCTRDGRLDMPILEDLSIRCRSNSNFAHVYASWSHKNAKRLKVTNFIPKPVFGQYLSYCHIKFTRMFDVECLLRFIGSLSLKDLKIELVDISEAGYDGGIEEHAGVDISSITSYSFHVIGKISIMFARRVLRTIFPPNTVEMSFFVVYPNFCEKDVDIWPQTNQVLLLFHFFFKGSGSMTTEKSIKDNICK
ncbi:hypothetical protein DFH11DRAFT_194734 [Phellopilus nigrolimitatus]|nr:hypothetical protein DFH11DRAFT_194734 [Phellopilus nigrolimitatus]